MSRARPEPPRRPKGQQPAFFDDPAIDQLHAAVITLASELAVAFDRIDTLERLLERKQAFTRQELEHYAPDERAAEQRAARRMDIAERVLRPFVNYRESIIERASRSDNLQDDDV